MNPKYSLKKVNVALFNFLFCSGQQFNSLGPQFAISFSEVRSNFLLYFSGGPGSDFGPNRDLCWQGFPADQLRKVCRRNLEQWHACQWQIRPQCMWSLHADLLPSSAEQIIEVGKSRPLLGVWNHWERDEDSRIHLRVPV